MDSTSANQARQGPSSFPPADLELKIGLESEGPGRVLSFELLTRDPLGDFSSEEFQPVSLSQDPTSFIRGLLEEIQGIKSEGSLRPEDIPDLLADFGSHLTRELLPEDLQERLASHRGASLQIVSEEPWIPWEILRLGSAPDDFLCTWFDVARWAGQEDRPVAFPLRHLGLIAPDNPDLETEKEAQFVESLRRHDRRISRIPARPEEIRQTLARGMLEGRPRARCRLDELETRQNISRGARNG